MALSELAVRLAKATGRTFNLADFDVLSLNVSSHSGKAWHFRYYWGKITSRSESHRATIPKLACGKPGRCVTKRATFLQKGLIRTFIANRSVKLFANINLHGSLNFLKS